VERTRLDRASETSRGANNFDLLRLVAALLVVFHHSFALTGTDAPLQAVEDRTHISWGATGVLIFFAISGFLIPRSWTYDPRLVSYAVKRALRLLPALVVSLILTAFVLGPLVTSLDTSTYLEAPRTKAYVVLNSSMWTIYDLPGVFTHNVYPNAVNGSLWTLSVEVKAYALIAILGLIGVFRRRRGAVVVSAIAILTCLWTIDGVRHSLPLGDRAVASLFNLQANDAIVRSAHEGVYLEWARVFCVFALGAALFTLRRWIWLGWDVLAAVALFGVLAVIVGADFAGHALVFIVPFVVLMLAYRTAQWFRLPPWMGDYSYGIYIIAFPVQQAIAYWITPASGWVMFVLATPIALGFAALSWHFIEAPALTLKKHIARPLDEAVEESVPPAPRTELAPASSAP
jgi:peptidoglycan/LPS O-acetylase OafA/YrhL